MISLLLTLTFCDAVYEDQVGKADWYRSGLGAFKNVRFNGRDAFASTDVGAIVVRQFDLSLTAVLFFLIFFCVECCAHECIVIKERGACVWCKRSKTRTIRDRATFRC